MAGVNFGYLPMDTGLEKLLSHYGIDVHPSIVNDEECFKQRIPREMGGGERSIYFAPLIKNENINNQLDYMQNIKGLIALKISPISVDMEKMKAHKLTATALFHSSELAWEMKDKITLNPDFIKIPGPGRGAEKIRSGFHGRGTIPQFFCREAGSGEAQRGSACQNT